MDTYKECLVCGKLFKVCKTCIKGVDENYQWKKVVCCHDHFNYHIPIIDYKRSNRTETDRKVAREELERVTAIYGEIEYSDEIKPLVAEIMGTDNKTTETFDTADFVKQKTKK